MGNITLNGVEYTPTSEIPKVSKNAPKLNKLEYKIVRTYSAWVFAGYVESRNWQEVIMRKARRLWYWSGASSLSQLAMEWTKDPNNCKFPCEVDRVELLQVVEILDVTDEAFNSINSVKVWKQ